MSIRSCSSNQLRCGHPVRAGNPRGSGRGLDRRKHLLGGKQPGSDRGSQAGWHHEDHAAGWGGGAPSSYCPWPPGRVMTLLHPCIKQSSFIYKAKCWSTVILELLVLHTDNAPFHVIVLITTHCCVTLQDPVLDRLGRQLAENWSCIHEWRRQEDHPQGNWEWRLAKRTHSGLSRASHPLDRCQVRQTDGGWGQTWKHSHPEM